MAKYCPSCNYYTDDGAQQDCPKCGFAMQFTLLGRRGGQPDEPAPGEKPAWAVEDPNEWVPVEQPLQWRTAQISAGITFYFVAMFVWRWVAAAFIVGMVVSGEKDVRGIFIATALLTIAFCTVAAIVAGVIAGAATINWMPQGLGVAGGLLVIPLLLLLVLSPASLPVYMITILITTGVTVLGAFLGHKLLPPSRVHMNEAERDQSRAPERLAVG